MSGNLPWRSGPGMETMGGGARSYNPHSSNKGLDPGLSWGAQDDSHFADDGNARPGIGLAYERLKGYFGEPSRDRRKHMDEPEKENSDYAEAFNTLWGGEQDGKMNRNGHIEQTLIEKTVGSDNFYLQVLAPWRYSTSMEISWNMQIFNKTTLDKLPEEAVPRLLSQRRTGGSASLMRYGIALLLEATFAETAIGQRTYLMNIEQMRVATTDTASYGAMIALMEHEPYSDPAERRGVLDTTSDIHAVDKRLRDEIDNWGLIQKERDGHKLVMSKLRNRLANRGVTGNVTMWPQGVSGHMSMGTDGGGARNVESISFSTGSEDLAHDPMFRHRTIGAFLTLDDRSVHSNDVMAYRTSMMDTVAYDEINDKFFMVRYSSGCLYTGIWNFGHTGAPLTQGMGGGMMKNMKVYTYGQMYRKAATGNFDRAAEKIYQLGLQRSEFRSEFIASLSLFQQTDTRVQLGGNDFPTGKQFSEKLFDDARGFDEEDWAVRPVTVLDHQRAKDAEGALSLRALDDRADYNARVITSKRKMGYEEEEVDVPMTARAAWEAGMDEETVPTAAPDRYGYLGNRVVKIPGGAGVSRVVRSRTGAPQVQNMAGFERLSLDKYVDDVMAAVEPIQGSDAADTAGIKAGVKTMTKTILRNGDATEAQKATLLLELKRVVQGVVYTTQYDTRDDTIKKAIKARDTAIAADKSKTDFENKAFEARVVAANKAAPADTLKFNQGIVAGFAPFAARMQTRMAIDSVQDERTAIEEMMSEPGSSLTRHVPKATAEESILWKPDGSDDEGVVRLDVFRSDNETIGLPHDAFAATLAARHNVLFRNAVTDLLTAIDTKKGGKRSRIDAMYWSLALSQLSRAVETVKDLADVAPAVRKFVKALTDATSPKPLVASSAAPTATKEVKEAAAKEAAAENAANAAATAASVTLLRRLERAALSNGERGVLLSQSHLAGYINELSKLLATAITDSTAALSVTLDFLFRPDALNKATKLNVNGFVSPNRLNVDSLAPARVVAQVKPAGRVAANSEEPKAWSRALVENSINRASLHDGRFFLFCVQRDVPVALCLRMWRPNKCYDMASVLHMKAGKDGAANTFYMK